MRPDSKLYIVPFQGGEARLMKCNTPLMNSWHSFSPNGRWMAFSSKGRSPYTHLMLTHIDANGNDTPAILVENTTASNRAVNIPEFVNVPPDGLQNINPQATEFYRIFNQAFDRLESHQMPEAMELLHKALQLDPDDALAHYALATALSSEHREKEAVLEYRNACSLNGDHAAWFSHLAVSLALTGDLDEAIATWKKSLAMDPSDPGTEMELGTAMFEQGQAQEGYEHLRKAVEMAPNFPDAHNQLGWELGKAGRFDEAIEQLQLAISLRPTSVEYHFNLGFVLGRRGDFAGAVAVLQKAVELSEGKDWRCLAALAYASDKLGKYDDAVKFEREALDLAVTQHDPQLEQNLEGNLEQYQHDGEESQHP
jgi:Flp pilus assembly protein TadD